jgi:hypothetical protein
MAPRFESSCSLLTSTFKDAHSGTGKSPVSRPAQQLHFNNVFSEKLPHKIKIVRYIFTYLKGHKVADLVQIWNIPIFVGICYLQV